MIKEKLIVQAKEASFHLLNHEVVSFPTETVMGLAVIYNDFEAYNLLNKVKRRPEDKPYTLMIKDVKDIDKYAYINDKVRKVINSLMPGSITILVPAKEDLPTWVTHGSDKVGLRIPTNEEALEVLKEVKLPLLVPSANRSGERPCLNSDEVKSVFNTEIAYVVEGNAKLDKPSTIVDLTGSEPLILREGPISLEDIKKVYNS